MEEEIIVPDEALDEPIPEIPATADEVPGDEVPV